jgi:hypothetical protein
MSEPDEPPITTDPPRSPGAPRLEDLDVEVPEWAREVREGEDVEDTGVQEPPD